MIYDPYKAYERELVTIRNLLARIDDMVNDHAGRLRENGGNEPSTFRHVSDIAHIKAILRSITDNEEMLK